jgi:hypothetical protein
MQPENHFLAFQHLSFSAKNQETARRNRVLLMGW